MLKGELTTYVLTILNLLKDKECLYIKTFCQELIDKFPDKCKDVSSTELRLHKILERSKQFERYKGYIKRIDNEN